MRSPRFGRFGVLAALYFVQGLPYGFQKEALPIYLRARGVSLVGIGLLGLLAVPWMLKALPAPLVERYAWPRLGRRRSWILPLQLGMAACAAISLVAPPDTALTSLLVSVLLMNACAATMDIAVDGLAIDTLSQGELGVGNAIQVVGYKVGMLTGGGLLVWASAWVGLSGMFYAMIGLILAVFVLTAATPEPPARPAPEAGATTALDPTTRVADVFRLLAREARRPGVGALLGCIATYKLGESLADTLWTPFLVDRGLSTADIGLWVGTWGMAASIAGSLVGGLAASRVPLGRLILACAALRAVPIALEGLLTFGTPAPPQIIGVTVLEAFFGGALTTAMFTLMMSRVDRSIGATHFTLLATVEVLGKSPGPWIAGALGQYLGYPPVYLAATLACAGFLVLFGWTRPDADRLGVGTTIS